MGTVKIDYSVETLISGATFYGCGLAAAIENSLLVESSVSVGSDYVFAFLQGKNWSGSLTSTAASVIELAHHLKSDRSHVARTLSPVNLAPDIVRLILEGKAPERFTLNKVLYGFPENWQEQRELFGIE